MNSSISRYQDIETLRICDVESSPRIISAPHLLKAIECMKQIVWEIRMRIRFPWMSFYRGKRRYLRLLVLSFKGEKGNHGFFTSIWKSKKGDNILFKKVKAYLVIFSAMLRRNRYVFWRIRLFYDTYKIFPVQKETKQVQLFPKMLV